MKILENWLGDKIVRRDLVVLWNWFSLEIQQILSKYCKYNCLNLLEQSSGRIYYIETNQCHTTKTFIK